MYVRPCPSQDRNSRIRTIFHLLPSNSVTAGFLLETAADFGGLVGRTAAVSRQISAMKS
jgi:hypothetical protein